MLQSLVLGSLLLGASLACDDHAVVKRDVASGGKCGPSAGNAVCAQDLCCSAGGVCGTGAGFCTSPDCQLSYGPACDGNQVPVGNDLSSLPRAKIGSVPYGVSISHCTVNGKVALTFDDGPYIYTTELLDLLKKNNVNATFFVVGNNGGKGQIELSSTGYPAIIQRMYNDGHQIGSHTWSHQDLDASTATQRHAQIIRNEMALVDILGFFPTYLRPPYTRCGTDCSNDLNNLGYHIANYDIDTRDWAGDYTYAQNTYSSILTQHSPSSSSWISLAHDIQPNTVHSFAQYMIDQAKKSNYQLVRLGECLGDPEANWYRDPKTGNALGSPRRPLAANANQPTSAAAATSATPTTGTTVLSSPTTVVPVPTTTSPTSPASPVPTTTSPAPPASPSPSTSYVSTSSAAPSSSGTKASTGGASSSVTSSHPSTNPSSTIVSSKAVSSTIVSSTMVSVVTPTPVISGGSFGGGSNTTTTASPVSTSATGSPATSTKSAANSIAQNLPLLSFVLAFSFLAMLH